MAGIAGIAQRGKQPEVEAMLHRLAHRGQAGKAIIEANETTLGVVWTPPQASVETTLTQLHVAQDTAGPGHLAQAQATATGLMLTRDPLGVAPLYYGWTETGALCFASEVKSLLVMTRNIHELPPGHHYDGHHLEAYFRLQPQTPLTEPPESIAHELRRRLEQAVEACIRQGEVGAWLSGGLDSSTMAALARPHQARLHTFAAGLPQAPDLEYAREVAAFLQADHHEVTVTFDELLKVLPQVIYHLESFDAWLVRSSLTNYLTAGAAADYVPAVLSGEGGDELFAGYDYLRSLDPALLAGELIDITGRLHNTALQRVDRCAAAHSTVAHVAFLDPDVVEYALRIPTEFKLRDGIEKWILRQAMGGRLPERVLNRRKAKFWEGAGVGDLLADHARQVISDSDFHRERLLANGWTLNSKEELLYYRHFREQLGELQNLAWMGRSKGVPTIP